MTDPALLESTAPPAPPPAPPPAAPTGPLADLILVRLLPAKKSVGLTDVAEGVVEFFRRPPSREQVAEVVEGLRAAGLITPGKGQRLTDAGRSRALAYLGIAELPSRAHWGTVKAKYLVLKALGLSPTSADDAQVVGGASKLAGFLLKRKLELPVGTPTTLNGAVNGIACRAAGFPELVVHDFRTLQRHLLAKQVGMSDPITREQAARLLLDAPKGGMEGLRAVALAGLVGTDTTPPPTEPEPFDLEAFANTVRSAARHCPTGRFGDNKVFISHVWRQLADEPRFAPLGPAGFKQKLVEANRRRLLTLSRADLVQLMDPTDLCESETTDLNAVFHFITVGKE